MNGELGDISGAIGDIAVGAAIAKTAEPDADGDKTSDITHTHETACLNCETPLQGAHCHNCGQRAHVHRTLRGFAHDLMHGVLHFEGKFWRTLPLLAWRPGRVMREYIEGKRAKYVSPVALFLFTVFVSFAIFNASGGFGKIEPEIGPATKAEIQASIDRSENRLAKLDRELASANLDPKRSASLRDEIESTRAERDLFAAMLGNSSAEGDSDSGVTLEVTPEAAASPSDQVGSWLKSAWDKAKSNPGLMLYKLQTNAYKLSWLLIPLSLPFMWLLFPFSRRFKMYDHTVFVTYSISFMTMLAVVMSMGVAYDLWPLVILGVLYAPFHLYRSLRGTYSLSRFGALWRMVALSIGIWATIVIFVILMFSLVISG